MHLYSLIAMAALAADYCLDLAAGILNVRHMDVRIPGEFEGVYEAGRYRLSQQYLRVNTLFGLVRDGLFTAVLLAFIALGGFAWADTLVRSLGWGPIPTGLAYVGILGGLTYLFYLPFSVAQTFGIEQRFGFNRTTPATFAADQVKALLLSALLGGAALSLVLAFFGLHWRWAWLCCWAAVSAFQIVVAYLVPTLILPLFNRFTPLPDGDLRREIETYARSQSLALGGIFTMDGSKRSAKTNAFFTGFGKNRRIALFDTLIASHTTGEIVAVLAHETGHCKRRHVFKGLVWSLLGNGLMFGLLSLLLDRAGLYASFGLAGPSVYAGLVLFMLLYTPVERAWGIFQRAVSRHHERQADDFAVATFARPGDLVSALKKLSVHNLSNLTPHPFKVAVSYTHPPVLERIRRIRAALAR